ncbi:MAG: nitrilase-related carbon-nitrogen hydrolase [Nitrososphaerales archaeon]
MPRSKKKFYEAVAKEGASTPSGAVAMLGIAGNKTSKSKTERRIQDSPDPPKETFRYDTKPLRSHRTGVAPIQSNIVQADPKNPEPAVKQNLENAIKLIEGTMLWPPGKKDLLALTEFFLHGYYDDFIGPRGWTRKDFLKVARSIPGEETDRLGEKAKQYGIYISGDVHAKDPEWPKHYFHTNFLIGPNGKVIHTHWKAHLSISAVEWGTTTHDVLDEFVKRNGWDAVWPVAVTDIGNIATMTCAEGFIPETWRAFAFRGAEIYDWMMATNWISDWLRSMMQAMCAVNACYGMLTQPAKIFNSVYNESSLHNASLIVDPEGRILRARYDAGQGSLFESLPIEDLRRSYRTGWRDPILAFRSSMYRDIYTNPKYEKIPPNSFSEYLPKDHLDAERYGRKKARWSGWESG